MKIVNEKIEKIVKEQLSKYCRQKNLAKIDLNDYLYADLKIYGDDIEELIHDLSKEMGFDEYEFWRFFQNSGYYNPPEVSLGLSKIFYLDIKQLFKGKVIFNQPKEKGNDIKVSEIVDLIGGLLGE